MNIIDKIAYKMKSPEEQKRLQKINRYKEEDTKFTPGEKVALAGAALFGVAII